MKATAATLLWAATIAIVACGWTAEDTPAIRPSFIASPITAAGDFDSGVYVPFNDVPLASLNGAQGVVNGNAAISFVSPTSPTFEGTLDTADEVATFSSTIDLHAAVTLEIRVDAAGDFSGSVDLPVVPLTAFSVGAIVVTPFIYTTVTFKGTAEASHRVSLVAPFEASVQFALPGQPTINLVTSPQFNPEFGAPDAPAAFELGVEFEIGVIFLVEIEGVPIGGPSLAASLGINMHVSTLPSPSWSADLAAELRGAWTFLDPITSLPEIPATTTQIARKVWNLPGGALPADLGSPRWSRVYDLLDSETSAAVLKRGNGAVLMGNSSLGSLPWMAALDELGLLTWQNSAVSQPFGSMNAKSLIEEPNGDLVATGWTGSASGMRVERYNASGTPLWARTMVGQSSTSVKWNASVPTTAGGTILAGHINYVLTATQRCVFAEIDQSGAILWMTEVDLGAGATSPTINAVALTSTGEILGAGTVTYQDLPSPYDAALRYANGLVVRMNAAGSAVNAFAVGGNLSDVMTTVSVFPDDSYAIGGYSAPGTNTGQNWAWITSFQSDDAMRWSATYAGETNGSYGHVSAMAKLPENGLLVTGGFGTPTRTQEAWLFRINSAGMPVWFKSLRGPKDDTLTGVVKMSNGLLAFGYTNSVNDVLPTAENDLWVVRASVDGMVDFTTASGMDASNDAARWRRSSHVVRPFTPTNLPATLTLNVAPVNVIPAIATNELLTP